MGQSQPDEAENTVEKTAADANSISGSYKFTGYIKEIGDNSFVVERIDSEEIEHETGNTIIKNINF